VDEVKKIAELARQIMLLDGYHAPIVFVEGTKGKVAVLLESFGNTNDERVQDMLKVGIKTAIERNVGELELIVFVSEAWMGTSQDVLPSLDPKRTEMLMITSLDARTQDEDMQGFEVIRDQKDQVINLKDWHQPASGSVKGNLLQAFHKGYQIVRPVLN